MSNQIARSHPALRDKRLQPVAVSATMSPRLKYKRNTHDNTKNLANPLTKTQLDRLGDRLKQGQVSEADVRLLDEYRRSFSVAYDTVVAAITEQLGLKPTGRPAKSTTSVSEKLRRESIRLTQIQDIAGCRLVVENLAAQDRVVDQLRLTLPHTTIVDRRTVPSHGYRAVHVIVVSDDKLVEIQVRTVLQHTWAELSEKLSDVIDPAIKYGGGPEKIRELLVKSSSVVVKLESFEQRFLAALASVPQGVPIPDEMKDQLAKIQEDLRLNREGVAALMQDAIASVPSLRQGRDRAVSD